VTLRDLRRQMRGLGKLLLCQFQIAGLKGRVASMECCVCLFELVRFRWGRILRIRRSRQRHQKPDQEGSSKAARKGMVYFPQRGLAWIVVSRCSGYPRLTEIRDSPRPLGPWPCRPGQGGCGNVIRRVHFDGVIKVMEGLNGLVELEKCFSEQDVGSGGAGFQQDGPVQGLLCSA